MYIFLDMVRSTTNNFFIFFFFFAHDPIEYKYFFGHGSIEYNFFMFSFCTLSYRMQIIILHMVLSNTNNFRFPFSHRPFEYEYSF